MVHFRRVVMMGWVLVLFSGLGLAQDKRFEILINLGYTLSNGVNTNTPIGGGQTVDRITPKSGFSYGGGFNVFLSEAISAGFNFSQQNSKLEGRVVGGSKEEFADMTLANYHGVFTFHLADEDSPMRPFFLAGIGATNYRASNPRDPVNLPSPGTSDIESRTRFSTTWGGGIKIFPNESIGFLAQVRWTPTYIKTDPGGYWCSPFWPWQCWIVGDDQYSHQGEFSGGVVFRF